MAPCLLMDRLDVESRSPWKAKRSVTEEHSQRQREREAPTDSHTRCTTHQEPRELRGVIPNSFDHIFENIKIATDKEFLVRCAYLEIYNEEIRDLLGADPKKKVDLKQDPEKVCETSFYLTVSGPACLTPVPPLNNLCARWLHHRVCMYEASRTWW